MNPNPKLVIKHVKPMESNWTEGNDLLSKYFQLRDTGNGYRLHVSDDEKIKTDPHHIEIGVPFHFELDGLFWTVTLDKVLRDPEGFEIAEGGWSAVPFGEGGEGKGEGGGDVESGTFQAQSGGHPIEVGAKASA